MSNTSEQVTTKQNKQKNVRSGHHQTNYVAGVVGRISALFMADVGELANIDTTSKETLNLVMSENIRCLNIVHKDDNGFIPLDIKDYDFNSGKYSRDSPQAEPTATAQAEPQTPIQAVADTTIIVEKPMLEWIKVNKEKFKDFDEMRETLKANGRDDAYINQAFKLAFPVAKAPSVPLPPQ